MVPIAWRQAGTPSRLRIYLNDHLAGAAAGSALAHRCLANNRGTAYEASLVSLAEQISEDRHRLEAFLQRLGLARSALKTLAGVLVERAGRLKLNGQLRGYSPLSRLVELEGLCAGVEAKRAMWGALAELVDAHPRLAGFPFDEAVERASRQRAELETLRLAAAREAFADTAPTESGRQR